MLSSVRLAVFCLPILGLPVSAAAGDGWEVVVGAGPAVTSTYYDDDASSTGLATHFSFSFDVGPNTALKSKSGGILLEFGLGEGTYIGGGLRKRAGLDLTDSTDPAKAALPKIDGGVEYGITLGRDFVSMPDGYGFSAELSVYGAAQGAPDGVGFETSATLRRDFGANRFWLGVSARGGDAAYRQSYFGISATEAAASGLAQHTMPAGLDDIGVTVGFARPVAKETYIGASLTYSHLVGKAADSSKIARRDAYEIGIGMGYRF